MSQELTKEALYKKRYNEAVLTTLGARVSSLHRVTEEGVYFPSKEDPLGEDVLHSFDHALADLFRLAGREIINELLKSSSE